MGYFFDCVVVIMVLGSAFLGFKRGFVRELLDSLAIVAGIVVASILYCADIHWFSSLFSVQPQGCFWEFLCVTAANAVVVRVLAWVVQRALWAKSVLGVIEQLAGALLGAVKVFIVVGVVLIVLIKYPVVSLDWLDHSITAPLFLFAGRIIVVVLPAQFGVALQSFYQGK